MADKAYQIFFGDEAVEQEFYGEVDSLTVEENSDMASTLHLRLALTKREDGSWEPLDDERLAPYKKISAKIGFQSGEGLAGALGAALGGSGNDGLEPVFDGYVTAASLSLGSQPSETFLDVSAMDSSVLMSLEEKVARWPNLSDSEIVQQIVAAYGVTVEADATGTVHQENDTTIVQRGTDLQFVRNLARRNGLEFYFETNKDTGAITAFLRAPQLDATPQADLAIQFGAASNLVSFNARLSALRPLNVKTSQTDIKTAGANFGDAAGTQRAPLGALDDNTLVGGTLGALVTPKEAAAQTLALGPPSSDPGELRTIAQAVRDEAAWFISASGEINSDAYQAVLRPRRLVLIKGAGSQYSGKYYVTRVTHEIRGGGEYAQHFEGRRNARDVDGSEQFGGDGLGLPVPGF